MDPTLYVLLDLTYLWTPLFIQLYCHQRRGTFLCDAGMSTLPEEVHAPLTAGVGMSNRLTFQVLQACNVLYNRSKF